MGPSRSHKGEKGDRNPGGRPVLDKSREDMKIL